MEDPKTNSILDEANRLFLTGKLREAITYYDKILDQNPQHVSSLNNKGYALSKLKDFENAIKCYDIALENSPDDLSLLVNKISSFRKQKKFADALSICNDILDNNPKYNIALYHKERILFSMKNYGESVECCDQILDDYPDNADVLFDKSCNFAMLCKNKEALDLLERTISQGIKYKVKAKTSKTFEKLSDDARFKKLIL